MELYVYLNGEKRGPFAPEQVRRLLDEGALRSTDLAATERDGEMRPLAGVDLCPQIDRLPSGEAEPPSQNYDSAKTKPVMRDAGGGETAYQPRQTHRLETAAGPSERKAASSLNDPGVSPANDIFPPISPGSASEKNVGAPTLGSYARATIGANEELVYATSVHWILFVRYAVAALLVFFFAALPLAIGVQAFLASRIGWFLLPFTLLILLPPALVFMTSELVVTNRRILIKTGAVSRRTLEMFITKVESVGVDQSFLGRILDFGTVTIRGTGGSEEPFATIADPIGFRNAVQRVQGGGQAVIS